jgi:hypothetical protein
MTASIRTLVTIVAFASSTAVFAQTYNEAPQLQQQSQAQSQQNPTATPAPQWTAPNTAYMGKTRAQVYGELVEAQRNGQIAYLNRTVYAHH